MSKLINLPNLKLGSIEINRLQEFSLTQPIYSMIQQYGLLVSNSNGGDLGSEWRVEHTGAMQLTVMPGKGLVLDNDGYPQVIEMVNPLVINVSDSLPELTDINIYVKWQAGYNEAGIVNATNGSTTITGNGTKFTKLFGINRFIIINNAKYGILSVQSDTQLTLTEPFPAASVTGANFQVGGWHSPAAVGVNDSRIYQHGDFVVSVTTNEKASDEYWIATFVVDQREIAIVTDKRFFNLAEMYSAVSRRSILEAAYKRYLNISIRSLNNAVTKHAIIGFGDVTATVSNGILSIVSQAAAFNNRTLVNLGMFLDFQKVNASTFRITLPENWSAVDQSLEIEIYERWESIGVFTGDVGESVISGEGAEYIGRYYTTEQIWERIPQPYTEVFQAQAGEQEFVLSRDFIAGSTKVFVNGVRQAITANYTENVAEKKVVLIFATNDDETLVVDYFA